MFQLFSKTVAFLFLFIFHATKASDTSTIDSSVDIDASSSLPPGVEDEPFFPGPDIVKPPQQQTGSLTAADIDDNLNFITYMLYARRIYDKQLQQPDDDFLIPEPIPEPFPEILPEVTEVLPEPLPEVTESSGTGTRGLRDVPQKEDNNENLLPSPEFVEKRLSIQVIDESNDAFSCATVKVSSENGDDKSVELSAGTDGKLAVFPHIAIDDLGDGPWNLAATSADGNKVGDIVIIDNEDLENEIELQINSKSSKANAMDLAIVLDTTGSMCDELEFLQEELENVITLFLQAIERMINLRVSVVFYKDEGDDYVVNSSDFTDADTAIRRLKSEKCGGGGDYPEAVHSAWDNASRLDWSARTENVARVAFLIGDAPPHNAQIQASFDAALKLRANGVRMYGLAASDTNDVLEYLLRMVALLSHGRHLWLTNDSGIGNSKTDAKVACFQVTELEKLLTRVLVGEMEGSRVEPAEDEIIREFGSQEGGICIIDMNDPESALKPSGNDFNSGAGRPSGGGGGGASFAGGVGDAVSYLPPESIAEDEELDSVDEDDSSDSTEDNGNTTIALCFPGDSIVYVHQRGHVLMKDLALGDNVLVKDGNNGNSFSPVYTFGHKNSEVEAEYIQIDFEYVGEVEDFDDVVLESKNKSKHLKLSKDHMVFVIEKNGGFKTRKAIPASSVSPGDQLILSIPNQDLIPVVRKTSITRGVGAFAPFTLTGTISVNGVVASNYVSLQDGNMKGGLLSAHEQFLAHAFQVPHRIACHISWSFCQRTEVYNKEGISYWVSTPLQVIQWLLRQNWTLHMILLPVIFGIAIIFSTIEFLLLHWILLSFIVTTVLVVKKKKGLEKQKGI